MPDAVATSPHDVEQVLQPIPEAERTTSTSGQFWIWCGANIAPINWVLGALGINLGLGLRDTLIVLVAGNLIGMAIFGLFVVMASGPASPGWWAGVMLVHHFRFECGDLDTGRLFDPVGTSRLPDVNWAR